MNDNDNRKRQELREAWIESLLPSATKPHDNAERVARAIKQIAGEADAAHSVAPARKQRKSLRWGTVAVAASLLLGLYLFVDGGGSSGTAMAAVQRSLNVAAELLTRKYLLQVRYRTAGNDTQIDNELYVRGHDRFALRHPGLLPGTSLWFGKDESEAWVVPPVGPVRKGNDTVLSRWLRSKGELDTPYLHVTTLLTRMSRGYRVKSMPDEEIALPNGASEVCQRIRAVLTSTEESNLPDTIELWSSRDTGMAIRVVARWNLADGESGRESIAVTFQNDEPSLADDWFAAESHYEGERIIMRVDSLGTPILERPEPEL